LFATYLNAVRLSKGLLSGVADVVLDKEIIIGRYIKDFALVWLGRVKTEFGKLYMEEPAPKFFCRVILC